MREQRVNSSWVRSVQYVPAAVPVGAGVHGFLIVDTGTTKRAWLVPKWIVGLVMASKSKGRSLNRLVIGKFQSVKLEN